MSTIGTMAVNLLAKTKKFDKPIDKSRKKIGQLRASLKNVTAGLKGFATAALGAAGVAGLGAFVKTQLVSLDLLGKTSDKLGISTEALGAFQHGAKLAGVESKSLNTALQRMVRRSSEAANGNEKLQKIFGELGVSVKELKELDPAELYRRIGDGMKGITSQADKVRLTFGIFDTEGVGLVNAFAGGIRKAEEAYTKLGTAVNREDVKKIEAVNDALAILGERLTGFGRGLVISISDEASASIQSLMILAENTGMFKKTLNPKEQAAADARAFDERRFGLTPKAPKEKQGIVRDVIDAIGTFFDVRSVAGGPAGSSRGGFDPNAVGVALNARQRGAMQGPSEESKILEGIRRANEQALQLARDEARKRREGFFRLEPSELSE